MGQPTRHRRDRDTSSSTLGGSDLYWIGGSSSNDFFAAANWSPAQVPVTGDNLTLAAGTTVGDTTGKANVRFNAVSFGGGFAGFEAGETELNADRVNWKSTEPTKITGEIASLFVYDTAGGSDALVLDGTFGRIQILKTRGQIQILEDSILESLYAIPARDAYAKVWIGPGVRFGIGSSDGDGPALLRLHNGAFVESYTGIGTGGLVKSDRSDGLILRGRAECIVQDNPSPLGLVDIAGESRFDYRSGAKIDRADLWRTSFLTLQDNAAEPLTIETLTVNGGLAILATGHDLVTFTDPVRVNGGTVIPESGSTIGIV